MTPRYRFYIYLNDAVGVKQVVNPHYKTDVAKDYELENNQKFYRVKISGKFSFVREDYEFIKAQLFDTQFNFLIERSDDWGVTWGFEFLGKFFKTDCTINDNDKKVSIQPDPVDDYTLVLAGLDKEYDLIPLAPVIEPLVIQKRPLIQVYIPGDTIVSCFLGGSFWEQDADATDDLEKLVNDYHFALCNLLQEIKISVPGSNAGASGLYTGRMSLGTVDGFEAMSGQLYMNSNNAYYLNVVKRKYTNNPAFSQLYGSFTCEVKRTSDNVVLYRIFHATASGSRYDVFDFDMPAVGGGATGTATGEMATYRVYARYLMDVDSIRGLNTYELPEDDIVDYNRNYRRAIGYAISIAYISQNFSPAPTEWGRYDNAQYYLPPYSIYNQPFYPIARSTWRYASIWFSFDLFDNFIEVEGRKRYVLKDTYPVHSIINTLLKQFAPGITHTPTTDCSLFLYADQNPITFQKFTLSATQKTNVINGMYKQPAQKAMATLGQFLNMLRDTFRCYWHIENSKLRIEHVSWYEKGGSYSGLPVVGVDLTKLINPRNQKPWSFSSSEYSFDKPDMAERYQFEWMDDVTLPFEGLPIEVKSKFVTPGKIEEISISNFTSDIDMMLLNPGDISKDGFALFAGVNVNALVKPDTGFTSSQGNDGITEPRYDIKTETAGFAAIARFDVNVTTNSNVYIAFFDSDQQEISNTYAGLVLVSNPRSFNLNVVVPINTVKVSFIVGGQAYIQFYQLSVPGLQELPFVQRTVKNIDYVLQNGYLAFITLQPNFYTYDLPSRNVLINGAYATVFGIQKKKKQPVTFPMPGNPNMMQLVKTEIGDGTIDKMSINLHSRMTKTSLKYDTE
jgi:hypothetical protein